MDVRRELNHLNKEFRRYHNVAQEFVVWYEFLEFGENTQNTSTYDSTYDEGNKGTGGRKYKPGVILPVLLASESEDSRRSIPDGRQAVQTIEFKAAIKDLRDAGVSDVWEYRYHLRDIFFYDGRVYGVSDYRVRGRLKSEVFVIVQGFEIYVDEEFVNDEPPVFEHFNFPWRATLPTVG